IPVTPVVLMKRHAVACSFFIFFTVPRLCFCFYLFFHHQIQVCLLPVGVYADIVMITAERVGKNSFFFPSTFTPSPFYSFAFVRPVWFVYRPIKWWGVYNSPENLSLFP